MADWRADAANTISELTADTNQNDKGGLAGRRSQQMADWRADAANKWRTGGQTQPTNGGLVGRRSQQMADWWADKKKYTEMQRAETPANFGNNDLAGNSWDDN
jgi:hypothetical protein